MRLTVQRVYDFGPQTSAVGSSLLSPSARDVVREAVDAFGMASTREEWEREAASGSNVARAADVMAVVRELDARSLCSHGVGGALLERQIHVQAPNLRLVCADFAPRGVGRLRLLFPEVEIVRHDLARDDPPTADLHLMHRLDQELDAPAWRQVFARVRAPVLFVPSEVLTRVTAMREVARRFRHRRATFAGWFRNQAALRDL